MPVGTRARDVVCVISKARIELKLSDGTPDPVITSKSKNVCKHTRKHVGKHVSK